MIRGPDTVRQVRLELHGFRPHELQEHAASNPKQPGLDGRISSEANRRPTRADERLLSEFFSLMPISDKPQEIRKHLALMGAKYILKLHVGDCASCPLVSRETATLQRIQPANSGVGPESLEASPRWLRALRSPASRSTSRLRPLRSRSTA